MSSQMQETIAGQLHHMKPDEWVPGVDVGMEPGVSDDQLRVVIMKPLAEHCTYRLVEVEYDRGSDLYNVRVADLGAPDGPRTAEYPRVYCDQLGELVFGLEAKQWTQPFGGISDPVTGETIAEW